MNPKIEAPVKAWDEGQWEFTLVFEGLSDEDLWRRAHPNLLSVGELAGHVAFGEAQMFPAGAIESPFFDKAFDYYPRQVAAPLTKDLTVQQVLNELKKVHAAVKAQLEKVEDFDEKVSWRDDWTWRGFIRYQVFHVAYHCGQAYSVRHLMGHVTTDN
jgi:hypothetical protein